MSRVTRLTELCAAFRLSDAQLHLSLQTDASTRSHARLLRRTTVLLDRIEQFVPASVEELDELIDFFARRRLETPQSFATTDFCISQLVKRHDRTALPREGTGSVRLTRLPEPLPKAIEGEDLARMILRAPEHVIAIGPDKRYLAINACAAKAHHTTPSRMAGRHMLEVVGCSRYREGARQRVDLAFSGRPQSDLLESGPMEKSSSVATVHTRAIEDSAGRRYAVLQIVHHKDRSAPN